VEEVSYRQSRLCRVGDFSVHSASLTLSVTLHVCSIARKFSNSGEQLVAAALEIREHSTDFFNVLAKGEDADQESFSRSVNAASFDWLLNPPLSGVFYESAAALS
jgi:hypothetical protein